MSKIKRLAGETVLYGLGSMLPRFLNFLLVILHTDVFRSAEYGVVTLLYGYVAVINVVFTFGMETAYFRFASKPGADERRIFDLAQTVVVGISLISTLALAALSLPIADGLTIPGQSELVIMMAVIMFIDAAVAIPFARLRLQQKPVQFAIGKVTNVGIYIGLNLYFLKFTTGDPEVISVFTANLIANAFFILMFVKTLWRWRPAYDRDISPEMIRYGYPIMITGLAGMTNETFSRLTLNFWLPDNFYPGISKASALGIFGACYKFATFMSLAVLAFRYAAEPFFFANSNEKNSPQLFARVNHYFVIVCCLLLFGVSTNLDILKHFLRKDEYWEGLDIVPVLLLANLFLGVYYNFSVWFKLSDKTHVGTLISIGGVVITVAGNFLLIPVMGYMGSSVTTLLCYFSMMAICYGLGQKNYPIPYTIGKDFLYVLATTALLYGVNSISFSDQIAASIFHVGAFALFVGVILFLERRSLKQLRA